MITAITGRQDKKDILRSQHPVICPVLHTICSHVKYLLGDKSSNKLKLYVENR